MQENIVVLTFAEDSKAYQALSELKQAAVQSRVQVRNAAVIARDAAGTFSVRDGASDGAAGTGPWVGTLLGSLIGILGGPLGVLLGAASGALLGSAVSIDRLGTRASLIDQMLDAVPPGSTAVIATLGEYATEVVDQLAAALDGFVLRRPAAAVQAEVDAVREAQNAAAKEARRVLREQQKDEWKDKWDHWTDELGDQWAAFKQRLKSEGGKA
ncbi:DUF1269 domain-containing protein [Pseudomonas aeruginosa]|nr:DUF1269 domain-containing protein [Pseudomonas aeruginosa]EIU3159491.1 DUF1269 domain-containing protein [Pseudomonas aeruginosa]EIU4717848.1 DUF1269 domain-containing protein [Pseudomonas aeruginosa]EIU4772562.1 DUF1269 domain-containing protein [Pseudomonas aeruginosa]EIU4779614.1 DUF1269 domain-containing protein [Pseudomonas aeruginosa]